MVRSLNLILSQLEEEFYIQTEYKLLFPDLKKRISHWISLNAPHLEQSNPLKAISLALKQSEFSLNFSNTKRLIGILGEDFSEKLQHWSKLGVTLDATYVFGAQCICEIKHYSFNDRLGFAQWKKQIKDDDLQLRLSFGEPLVSVFKEWRERRVKDIEDRYNEELQEFAKLFQTELDSTLSKVLNKISV
ncbi:hypothetical protein [Priestia aryabhattai]